MTYKSSIQLKNKTRNITILVARVSQLNLLDFEGALIQYSRLSCPTQLGSLAPFFEVVMKWAYLKMHHRCLPGLMPEGGAQNHSNSSLTSTFSKLGTENTLNPYPGRGPPRIFAWPWLFQQKILIAAQNDSLRR